MRVRLHVEGEDADRDYIMPVEELLSLTHAERGQLASYVKRSGARLSVPRADIEAIRCALRAARERETQAAKERDAACIELRDFAYAHFPELARSVQEGYNVAGGTVLKLAEAVERAFAESATIVRQGTSMFHDLRFKVRDEPRPEASELRSRVFEHVSQLVSSPKDWPSCVRPFVSEVMRIEDFGGGTRTPEKSTGVVVTLMCAATPDFLIVIRSE